MLAGFTASRTRAAAVSDIIAAGHRPRGGRDDGRAGHRGRRGGRELGYPDGADAVLIVELDGPQAEVEAQFAEVTRDLSGRRRVRDRGSRRTRPSAR